MVVPRRCPRDESPIGALGDTARRSATPTLDQVRITSIGHAGFLIETTGGRILCDPWATPTFFGSWHPFPRVDTVDPATFDDIDYLYVSHVHRDHLDPDLLAEKVAPTATVLLPDFGVDVLRTSLEELGFERFVETHNGEIVDLPGDLRIAIGSLAGPHVGPMGDSMLVVADPTAVVLNQNDAHPADLDLVAPFGPVDAHLLQYSGAIWYPMVYDIPGVLEFNVSFRSALMLINECASSASRRSNTGSPRPTGTFLATTLTLAPTESPCFFRSRMYSSSASNLLGSGKKNALFSTSSQL